MAGYIGNIQVPQATQRRQDLVATAGQTLFNTLGYEPKYVDVYLNGVKLIDITEYTATNGTDITLTSAASAGDTLSYMSFTNFTIVETSGDLNVSGNLTVSNDTTLEGITTLEGTTIVEGSFTSQGIDDNATSTVVTLTSAGNMEVGGDATVTGNVIADSFNDIITTDDTVSGGEAMGVGNTLPTDRASYIQGIHLGSRAVLESPNDTFSAVDSVLLTNNGYATLSGIKTQVNGPITRFQMDDGSWRFTNYHSSNGVTTPTAGDVIAASNFTEAVVISSQGELTTQSLVSNGDLLTKGAARFEGRITEEVHILSGTSVSLDPTNGTIQTHTLTGNTTYTESLIDGSSITLMIASTTNTVTWPTINWVNNDTLPPELGSTGSTVVSIWHVGGTLYGAFVGNSVA